MRSYAAPQSWYDDYQDQDNKCLDCEETQSKRKVAQEHLEMLLDELYGTQEIDQDWLQNTLDVLCDNLRVAYRTGNIPIVRKTS